MSSWRTVQPQGCHENLVCYAGCCSCCNSHTHRGLDLDLLMPGKYSTVKLCSSPGSSFRMSFPFLSATHLSAIILNLPFLDIFHWSSRQDRSLRHGCSCLYFFGTAPFTKRVHFKISIGHFLSLRMISIVSFPLLPTTCPSGCFILGKRNYLQTSSSWAPCHLSGS